MFQKACPLLMVGACALAAGCSGGGPVTHAVTGQISYQGQPVADAQVGFVPADGSPAEQKPASGQTDAQGRYTLSTYLTPSRQAAGAMAGKYKVTVQKGFAQNQIVSYEDLRNRKPQLPPAYAGAKQTPLTAEVTASGPNQFDFTLQDAP